MKKTPACATPKHRALMMGFMALSFGVAQAADTVNEKLTARNFDLLFEQLRNTQKTFPSCDSTWPDCLPQKVYHRFKRAETGDLLKKQQSKLEREFKIQGLEFGAPVYIRMFKHPSTKTGPALKPSITKQLSYRSTEGILELWVQQSSGDYRLFKRYPICAIDGTPGPKKNEGDYHNPEGFYSVSAGQMNPNSDYHLSFNIGYPNEFDQADRLSGASGAGGEIMVHGNCVTIGCFAMTDPAIEEIYTIMAAALNRNVMSDGKPYRVPVHSFPFPITDENFNRLDPVDLGKLSKYLDQGASKNFDLRKFWANLKPGYEFFEKNHIPPDVGTALTGEGPAYQFSAPSTVPVKQKCP